MIDRDTLTHYNPGKTRELEGPSFASKSLVLQVGLLVEMVDNFMYLRMVIIGMWLS